MNFAQGPDSQPDWNPDHLPKGYVPLRPPIPKLVRPKRLPWWRALLVACGILTGCTVTVETRPDGSRVERKEADRDVLRFGADVLRAYSPREIERGGK